MCLCMDAFCSLIYPGVTSESIRAPTTRPLTHQLGEGHRLKCMELEINISLGVQNDISARPPQQTHHHFEAFGQMTNSLAKWLLHGHLWAINKYQLSITAPSCSSGVRHNKLGHQDL